MNEIVGFRQFCPACQGFYVGQYSQHRNQACPYIVGCPKCKMKVVTAAHVKDCKAVPATPLEVWCATCFRYVFGQTWEGHQRSHHNPIKRWCDTCRRLIVEEAFEGHRRYCMGEDRRKQSQEKPKKVDDILVIDERPLKPVKFIVERREDA